MTPSAHLIGVNIGNSRTHVGVFEEGHLSKSQRFDNDQFEPLMEYVAAAGSEAGEQRASVLLASVNEPIAKRIAEAIRDRLEIDVFRVGNGEADDVPVPIGLQLDPETMTGVDRLLNAAAAYDMLKQACIVVDAGTAVTVDFVDGEGTFHGGAIAPGASLQLKSLHAHTGALPDLTFHAPDNDAFGRNTAQAMYHGVFHGIRGMVQRLVEQYAEAYGAFPMVIATGGDARTLFENEPLIDRVVPDLTLFGIEVAAKYALSDPAGTAETDPDQ